MSESSTQVKEETMPAAPKSAKKSSPKAPAEKTAKTTKAAKPEGKAVEPEAKKTPVPKKPAKAAKAAKKDEAPEGVKATLEYLVNNGGSATRRQVQDATKNPKPGLGWLAKKGYVAQKKVEGSVAHGFTINAAGKKYLGTL